ncbi:hypothetical protein V1478_010946 [Vespula squamosa]|uniref:Uncharacterized protein n=1 Tax=Vespula squamosa TaxID=30214 RepID=A0ABD2AFU0_VESSQ
MKESKLRLKRKIVNEKEEIEELEASAANDDDEDDEDDEDEDEDDDDRRVKTLGTLEKYGRGEVEKGWKERGWRVATLTPVHCANNASYRLHNERGYRLCVVIGARYSYPSGKERGTRSEEKTAGSLLLLLAASGRRESNRVRRNSGWIQQTTSIVPFVFNRFSRASFCRSLPFREPF